jgi:hypothetical protein
MVSSKNRFVIVIVYYYASCTRQSIVEQEGLEHNEFNMLCETSVTYFSISPLFIFFN